MQKSIFAMLAALTLSPTAFADESRPNLSCEVAVADGDLQSFVPPVAGDQIVLALDEPGSITLDFARDNSFGSYISMNMLTPFTFTEAIPHGSHSDGGWRFASTSADPEWPRRIEIDVLHSRNSGRYSAWIVVHQGNGAGVGHLALLCSDI